MGEQLARVGDERFEEQVLGGVSRNGSPSSVTSRRPRSISSEPNRIAGAGGSSGCARRIAARARASSSSIANGFVT